jgi:hypothetical protein
MTEPTMGLSRSATNFVVLIQVSSGSRTPRTGEVRSSNLLWSTESQVRGHLFWRIFLGGECPNKSPT